MKRGGANLAEAERWLKQAEKDLDAARVSARAGHHEWACFQAQQAGEKGLKAVLHACGRSGVSSHSLEELLRHARKDRPELAPLEAAAKGLDEVYIPTRYPNGLPGPSIPGTHYTEGHSKACIGMSESILIASIPIIRGSKRSSRG